MNGGGGARVLSGAKVDVLLLRKERERVDRLSDDRNDRRFEDRRDRRLEMLRRRRARGMVGL